MVETLSQIRVRFANPMIPLEAIESPDEQTKLQYFEITPALPGKWRFVTPHMAIFEFNRALPNAIRVRVTLKAGLADLNGNRMLRDVSWTFENTPIYVETPSEYDKSLNPTYILGTNAVPDLEGLRSRSHFWDVETGRAIPFSIEPMPSPSPYYPRPFLSRIEVPQEQFQVDAEGAAFDFKPLQTLRKNALYRLSIQPGVWPLHGNLATLSTSFFDYHTYEPLLLKDMRLVGGLKDGGRASARFYEGTVELDFSNDLDEKSVQTNISISPAPLTGPGVPPLLQTHDYRVIVNPWVLRPRTRYTLTIRGSLRDVWHQPLGKTISVAYATSDIAADFSTLEGFHVFPSTLGLRLPANVLTLPGDAYQVAYSKLQPETLAFSMFENMPDYANWTLAGESPLGLPPVKQWPSTVVAGTTNRPTSIDLGLADHLGSTYGLLEYGMTAQIPGTLQDVPDSLVVDTGRINVTNLGVFAQVMPQEALALVHRLSDGAPVSDARVEFYIMRSDSPTRSALPCAVVSTDASGMATLEASDVHQCWPWHETRLNESISVPRVLVIARSGTDWTAAIIGGDDASSNAFEFGWDASSVLSRGALFSDRGLYQPGEKASFEGYAFHLQDGILERDEHTRFALTLRQPDGTEQTLGSVSTDEFGAFPYTTTIPAGADLGDYSLIAISESGVQLNCSFRVAEFKAPNFKVSIAADKAIAVEGDTVNLTGHSDYLFGQPVDNAGTHISIVRVPSAFVPRGWEDKNYSWTTNAWPEPTPSVSPGVLDVNGRTDTFGVVHLPVLVASDLPYAMTYNIDLVTSDSSNLAAGSSTSFTALPSPVIIGLFSDYLAPAGKPLKAQIVTTDPNGRLIGRNVQVSLARIWWDSKNLVHMTDEGAADIATSNAGAIETSLIPKSAGWYRLRANFAGTSRRATETDRDVWVYGPGEIDWTNSDDGRSVALQLDRDKYEPGDRATVLVKSPFSSADLYLAVIRHGTLWHSFEHVIGSAPAISFAVTPQMLPGAQIEAVLVRRGPPIESLKPGAVTSLVRFGSAELTVNLDRRQLDVTVKPADERVRPGGMQRVDVQLTDFAGAAVRGQVTIMVVDESILQLYGYRPPDLVAAVYGNWPVSALAADNRLAVDLVQPRPATLDQLRWYGSGMTTDVYSVNAARAEAFGKVTGAPEPAPTGAPVRVNFQQLAYFNGDVRTDDQGHATVSFKVPDNLTTWRVLAVAAAEPPADDATNFRFGNGDATFITTQPLLANPLLPQFARPGDLFQGGLATNNTTGAVGTMRVNGSLTGALVFDNGGVPTATVSTQFPAAVGTQSQRFPMSAISLGDATVEFRIALGESGDAFRVPFSVLPLDITESVVETGTTTTDATIPLSIDPNVDNFAGGLQITMASTLLPEILVPARECFLFEYLPFSEPLSSRLMVAADMQILGKKYGQTLTGIDPVAEAADDVSQLAKLQRQDGGFAWWPGQFDSDPYLTGYAAQALGRMQQAGLNTEPVMVTSVHAYLTARLDNPDPHGWCLGYDPCIERMRFEAMLGLAALGDLSDKRVADVYAERNAFDLVTQIELARFMTALPAWKPQADAMALKIQELVYETGRYAVLNTPEDMWWYDSITKGQAETVRLYVAQKYDTAIIDRMVRSLLALRRKGSWANTYDDAQALNALIDYAQLEPEPPAFTATANLNGVQIANNTFSGYQDSVRDTFVATADLPRGASDLRLRKGGSGTLHYVVSYTYRLHGPQPGAEAGLLISRDVRPVGKDDAVAHMGLGKPLTATTLPAAQVYDVGLTIIVDHPVNQVIIVDPLPAGMEAVDATFNTTPRSQTATYGDWQIDYQVIHHDRVVAFANYLAPGIYTMHYLSRTVTPGTYEWPGSQAFLEYAPEEFGRSASTTLTIP